MAQNLVKFKSLSKSNFNTLSTKESNMLYFISDTKQIFKGDEEYCSAAGIEGLMTLKSTIQLTEDQRGVNIGLPSGYKKGNVYIVTGSGEAMLGSTKIEVGDMLIAIANMGGTASASDFAVFKSASNIDEAEWEE